MRLLRSIAALALTTASLAACADKGGVAPRARAGETRILLTDAPFPYDRIARVDIHVVSVSGSLSTDTTSTGQFTTLATPDRRINVLGLQSGATEELGSLSLPEGVITAVRMVIDASRSSITLKDGRVLTGSSTPGIAWQSSAGRPTLNALVHEQILVPDSGGVVVVDFDVGRTFIPWQEIDAASRDSGFVFSPVLRAADANRTGAIAGIVRAHSASGAPVANASLRLYLGNPSQPENTWPTLATARSGADGKFTFAFVTRSAYWSAMPAHAGKTYIVAVDPPSGAGLGRTLVPGVTVNARAETAIGTVVLP